MTSAWATWWWRFGVGPVTYAVADPSSPARQRSGTETLPTGARGVPSVVGDRRKCGGAYDAFEARSRRQAAGDRQFRPGSHFTEFYFDETGDTNALTEAGAQYGVSAGSSYASTSTAGRGPASAGRPLVTFVTAPEPGACSLPS